MRKIFNRRSVAVALMLLAIGISGYYVWSQNQQSRVPGADNNTKAADGTEYPGPTEDEIKSAEAHKQKLVEQSRSNATNTESKRSVAPVITSADATAVRGYIGGIIEDNGTCTAILTQGDSRFEKSSSGFKDATTTTCEVIRLSRSDFSSPGTWTVKLSYTSDTYEGASNETRIEVQQ